MDQLFPASKVAIIGAGLSGASCARELSELGVDVKLFDKGRGPGGRASTRRVTLGGEEAGFDHGAQYFTVRDPSLELRLQAWIEAGVAAPWKGRIAVLGPGGEVESYSDKPRFVGVPGMNALGRYLSEGLDVRFGVQVERVERANGGTRLFDSDGKDLGLFSAVVSTAPPVQTEALLSSAAPEIARRAASVEMKPCWAVMAAFESPVDVPYDGGFINAGPLTWVARTSDKPGRRSTPDRWVLHAGPVWSTEHLELDRDEASEKLLAAAEESMGVSFRNALYLQAHRWRYAIAENPLDEGALFDPSARIGACGDWAFGNRIEGAILSGLHMARAVGGAVE